MEFLLPIELLSAPQLHRFAQGSDTLTEQATSLDFKDAKGMLKGFIDLVFEHQGKFYVLDWKSNHLGDAAADYTKANISKAMIEHRYDVQYQLYTLALHRYLKNRIPNYDYDTHFGGVYYLFLRGIQKESNSGIFFTRPDKTFIENLDAHIAGELA
jgi:exodeoxyribonuclease V beta subunit